MLSYASEKEPCNTGIVILAMQASIFSCPHSWIAENPTRHQRNAAVSRFTSTPHEKHSLGVVGFRGLGFMGLLGFGVFRGA